MKTEISLSGKGFPLRSVLKAEDCFHPAFSVVSSAALGFPRWECLKSPFSGLDTGHTNAHAYPLTRAHNVSARTRAFLAAPTKGSRDILSVSYNLEARPVAPMLFLFAPDIAGKRRLVKLSKGKKTLPLWIDRQPKTRRRKEENTARLAPSPNLSANVLYNIP